MLKLTSSFYEQYRYTETLIDLYEISVIKNLKEIHQIF